MGVSYVGQTRGTLARRRSNRKFRRGPVTILETSHQEISFVKRGGGYTTWLPVATGAVAPGLYTPAAAPIELYIETVPTGRLYI